MSSESKSPGWIKKGTLWEYQTPLNPAQRAQENIKSWKDLHAMWKERMGQDSFCCPECGSKHYEQTDMGWWPTEDHYHDPNQKRCYDCGHSWFLACPTCGQTEEPQRESDNDE